MQVVMVSGTVGVGKTTASEAWADSLAARGVRTARIDLDQVRLIEPAPADDRFNLAVTLANVAAMSLVYRRAGAQVLVLTGVVESEADLAAFSRAVEAPVRCVRLRADHDLVRTRLRQRHRDDPTGLDWHLNRLPELDLILDAATYDHQVLDITGLTVAQVAAWLDHSVDLSQLQCEAAPA